ncbi:MAG: HD domain-containing protein [Candidatus Thorarchaeota archaeon]|jgi:putative nucleotidyltransferase with HDIG domain
MVFERDMTQEEKNILKQMEEFVRHAHAESDSHDYAHVLTVARYTIDIAKNIEEPVDPFVCIAGALLHDIGKTTHEMAHIHGLFGAALAEEFLDGLKLDRKLTEAISRVVVRHTQTSKIPPETPEEKLVADADTLDRLGLMGLLRGFMGKRGESMDEIMNRYMEKRRHDFEKLHFEYSKEIGDALQDELMEFIIKVEDRLRYRLASIEDMFENTVL